MRAEQVARGRVGDGSRQMRKKRSEQRLEILLVKGRVFLQKLYRVQKVREPTFDKHNTYKVCLLYCAVLWSVFIQKFKLDACIF